MTQLVGNIGRPSQKHSQQSLSLGHYLATLLQILWVND
jgi:hypothetical protein